MTHARKHPTAWFVSLFLMMTTLTGSYASSQPPDSDETTTISAELTEQVGPLRPGRSPLLREGSQLVNVKGWMRYDPEARAWRYVIDEEDGAAPGYELTLLPNSILQEMIELRQIARGQSVAFEVSGRVLVYHSQSFFLASHAPQLVENDESHPDEPEPNEADGDAVPTADDDSVDSIKENLRKEAGRGARPISNSNRARADKPGLRLEGSMLVSRRGRLTRTTEGAWSFVFDADASSLGDPPMTLLPCLLLEKMEAHARTRGEDMSMILSGQVYLFNDHNYLYPTVFQIPRGRTRLTP